MTNCQKKHGNQRRRDRNKYMTNTTSGNRPKRGNYKPRRNKNAQYFDTSNVF